MRRLRLVLAIVFGSAVTTALAADATQSTISSTAKLLPDTTQDGGKPSSLAKPGSAAKATAKKLKPAASAASDHAAPIDEPSKASEQAEPLPATWTDADVAVAQARCNALLASVDAVTTSEPPFRSGNCGSPAAVRLVSIGSNPQVTLSPAPVLTCDMVAALATWIKSDLQPLARKHLGQPIVRIETMSDYSCRAAYGRKGNRLSEHAKANALDIRSFVLAKGGDANVLAAWGRTERDVKRDIAVAKAAAEKADKVRAAAIAASTAGATATEASQPAVGSAAASAKRAAPPPAIAASAASGPPATIEAFALSTFDAVRDLTSRTLVEGMPKPGVGDGGQGTAFAPPSRLGGPKIDAADPMLANIAPAVPTTKQGQFLRAAHAAACRIFGTTLGPEANEAHRNHFHVDMAERKNRRWCE